MVSKTIQKNKFTNSVNSKKSLRVESSITSAQPTKKIQDQEWYQYWREVAKAIIYQTLRNSRIALIEGKWKLGEHIEVHIKDFNRSQIYGERISEKISDDLGISKREVNRCRQFYRFCIREFKAKDWDRVGPNLPEEKQISWNQIKTKWLPQSKESHQCDFKKIECWQCEVCKKVFKNKPTP